MRAHPCPTVVLASLLSLSAPDSKARPALNPFVIIMSTFWSEISARRLGVDANAIKSEALKRLKREQEGEGTPVKKKAVVRLCFK